MRGVCASTPHTHITSLEYRWFLILILIFLLKFFFLYKLLESVLSYFDYDSTWAQLLWKSSEEQSRPRSPFRSWRSHLPPEMLRGPLTSYWPYHTAALNSSTQSPRYVRYVLQSYFASWFSVWFMSCGKCPTCKGYVVNIFINKEVYS